MLSFFLCVCVQNLRALVQVLCVPNILIVPFDKIDWKEKKNSDQEILNETTILSYSKC